MAVDIYEIHEAGTKHTLPVKDVMPCLDLGYGEWEKKVSMKKFSDAFLAQKFLDNLKARLI